MSPPRRSRRRAVPRTRRARFIAWLAGRTPRERAWYRRLARAALVAVPAGLVLALGLLGAAYALVDIPDPTDIATARSTIVLDRNGREIARLHAEADRVDIPWAQMPESLREAVIAAEDRSFYRHPGVSLPSIVRAAFANLTGLGVKQGGSTITQQYVKNAYVGSERTLWRKMREAIVAVKIERSRSKDQILEAYLNTIYFGRGAYGIEAAARTYFGTGAKELTLARSALLAGIIRAPEAYDPVRAPQAARSRRDAVLRAMADLRFVPRAEAEAAVAEPVKVRTRTVATLTAAVAPHFVEEVRRRVVASFGADRVYRGGLVVRTTLDPRLQRFAEEAVRGVLDRPADPEAALVAVDTATGEVLALVGGRSFDERQFNLATQGRRQPGSAFKPFVLATALEQGLPLEARFRAPAKITLETGFDPWTVANYDAKDYGTIDLVRATEFSVNTVYAQLILKVGPKAVAETAARLGIDSRLAAVPSLALGTSSVSPLELTGAYATFARGGVHAAPHLIRRVTDAGGGTLFAVEAKPERVLDEPVANTVAHALAQVVERGTGRRADLGARPVAGKTGTTEDHVDAWFAGFTRQIATTVWMGFPEGGRTMERVRGVAVTGGSFPAQIWRAFMERAVEGTPVEAFGAPSLGGTVSPAPAPSPSGSTSPAPTSTATPSPPPPTQSPKPKPTGSVSPPSPSPTPTGTG